MGLGLGPASTVYHMDVHTYVLIMSYSLGAFIQLFKNRLKNPCIVQISLGPHFSVKQLSPDICVRTLHAQMGLNGPDQPNLRPLPTYLMPLGPEAQFQLSPGQLVPAWATPQECQSQALPLALSPAVVYCPPWMNPIPGSPPHLVWWLLIVTGPVAVTNMALLWCCRIEPSQWDPLHLGCPLLPAHPPLWNSQALPFPGNCNYMKSSLKWNTSLKGQTLEKKKKMLVLPIQEEMKLHI